MELGGDKAMYLSGSAWLLIVELIAWDSDYLQPIFSPLLISFSELLIVRWSESSLAGNIDDHC